MKNKFFSAVVTSLLISSCGAANQSSSNLKDGFNNDHEQPTHGDQTTNYEGYGISFELDKNSRVHHSLSNYDGKNSHSFYIEGAEDTNYGTTYTYVFKDDCDTEGFNIWTLRRSTKHFLKNMLVDSMSNHDLVLIPDNLEYAINRVPKSSSETSVGFFADWNRGYDNKRIERLSVIADLNFPSECIFVKTVVDKDILLTNNTLAGKIHNQIQESVHFLLNQDFDF